MSATDSVTRVVNVAVDPETAFRVFTEEIDSWYVRGPYSWNNPEKAVAIRFDPGAGGRWIEVWDRATGEGFVQGTITAWEPGRRLRMSYHGAFLPDDVSTEIEVRFEPTSSGTRVTLEHSGLDGLAAETRDLWRQRAWNQLVNDFATFTNRHGPTSQEPEHAR